MLNPIVTAEMAREHANLLRREAEFARRHHSACGWGRKGILMRPDGLGRALAAVRRAFVKQMPALSS